MAGFVQTKVYCPKAIDAVLLASASQYAAGFINGEKVFEDQISMGLLLNEDRVPVKLSKIRLPEKTIIPAIKKYPDEFMSVPGHLVVAQATASKASP